MSEAQSQTPIDLPIFDVFRPLDSSSLSSLREACKEWGYFLVTNHGISNERYDKLRSLSSQLFSLPSETKLKIGPSSSLKTYTPQFIASPFYEGLRVSGPDFHASAQNSAKILFDHENTEFSEVIQEYGDNMSRLCKRILEVILMSLGDGLDRELYETEFKKCHGYLRIINYATPGMLEKGVEGLGKHTDMSCITILYQDDQGGLQVRSKEGQWMDIVPCEGTVVVNIGDMLEAWSNGRLRSSEHRVVLRHLRRNRFTLGFFWSFEDEKVIFAPEGVVGEGNLRMYRPFLCSDYLRFREFNDQEKYEQVGYTVKDFAGVAWHQIPDGPY